MCMTMHVLCLMSLITIYDKSDISNVSDAYIRSLVQSIEKK